MPGRQRKIDPRTGDYVENSAGTGFEYTTTLATSLYHQMKTPINEWWGDPDAGSGVARLSHGTLSPAEIADARGAVLAALQVFVSKGLARDPTVVITTERDRVGIETSIVDLQAGEIDVAKVTGWKV